MQLAGVTARSQVTDGRPVPLVSANPAVSLLALQYAARWRSDRPGQTYSGSISLIPCPAARRISGCSGIQSLCASSL